jgi:hypothetical protein
MIALEARDKKPSSQRNAISDFLEPSQSDFGIPASTKKGADRIRKSIHAMRKHFIETKILT